MTFEIVDYLTPEGRVPYKAWLSAMSDRVAKVQIMARVQRMAGGNFGDCKPLVGGVWELRINHGPGYRVYYARSGNRVVLLLTGATSAGNKPTLQPPWTTGKTGKGNTNEQNAPPAR